MLESWQDWVIVIQARSANGAAATLMVDAAWIIPADTYVRMEVPAGTLAADATWHMEAHRSGKDIVAKLADGSRLRGYGVPLLPPGNAAVWLAFETATGHTFASGGTIVVSALPRFRTEATA